LAGDYPSPDGFTIKITRSGDVLFAQVTGQPALHVHAESPTHCFYRDVEADLEFEIAPETDRATIARRFLWNNALANPSHRSRVLYEGGLDAVGQEPELVAVPAVISIMLESDRSRRYSISRMILPRLQQRAASRSWCNQCASWAPSLSLGRDSSRTKAGLMNNVNKILLMVWLCALPLLFGCATGRPFSFDDISEIQVGMTSNEVRAVAPQPVRIVSHYDGSESWWWVHDNGMRKDMASVDLRDGSVVEVPKRVSRTKQELLADERAARSEVKALRDLEARAAAKGEALRKRRSEYVAAHPDLPADVRHNLLAEKICVGMPVEVVALSWGNPRRKSRTVTEAGARETWSYPHAYVWFEDGKVAGWHMEES